MSITGLSKTEIDAIAAVHLFQNIPLSQVEKLFVSAVSKEAAPGHFLLIERQKSDNLIIILKGLVEVRVTSQGQANKETIAILKAGETLGELGLLGFSRRTASAEASEQTKYVEIPTADIITCCERNTELGYLLMRNVSYILAKRMVDTTKSLSHVLYQC